LRYWLDLFTPYTWERFQAHGAHVSGFRRRQRKVAFERVKKGDIFVCYLVKLSRWCGILEVVSDAFEDSTPIFADENDPFPIRFTVSPKLMLDFEHSVPIELSELWTKLSFTRELKVGSIGWAQAAKLRQSLIEISKDDGAIISQFLSEQSREMKEYPIDTADLRHLKNRTVIRTEHGEVAVEVPDREDVEESPIFEVRESIAIQAKIAQLGATLEFNIWVPASDRNKLLDACPKMDSEKLLQTLPLNYDPATLRPSRTSM
jgi:EVE domain